MIQESEQLFRSIIENSLSGIFVVDNQYRFTYVNDMLCKILGYSQSEIIARDFRYFLDEESRTLVEDRYLRRQRGEEIPSRYEFSLIRKDGQKRWAEISIALTMDSSGKTVTVGQLLDITDRKAAEEELNKARAELESRVAARTVELRRTNELLRQEISQKEQAQEALRNSEVKYRHLVENANTIILELDIQGNVMFLNRFGLDFFDYSEAEILGRNIVGTIVPVTDSAGKDLEAMIDELVINPEKFLHNENENMKRNGERVWIVWTNQPLYKEEGGLRGILCIGINRTEQKKAEELISQQDKEKAAVEERNRLARDLHDAVSQTLFSTSLISEVLPRIWERNPGEGRKRLEEVRVLTHGALAEMRTLLLELRPTAIVEADLGELIKQLSESITGRSRIPVTFTSEGKCISRPEVKIAIYRIAQEALNNVAKHARASQAEVNLCCKPDELLLKIKDNGKGFCASSIRPDSLGLGIMQERAREIGATLVISSNPGEGTEVAVIYEDKTGGRKP